MISGNMILKIDKRLTYLMETHVPKIVGAPALSRAMHEAGILQPSTTKGVTEKETIENDKRTIQNHLNGCKVDLPWAKAYCTYFNCSFDFLLGLIDLPTHEKTDIAAETGLSESAIDNLKFLHSNSACGFSEYLEIINALLSEPDFTVNLSKDIKNYFNKYERYECNHKVTKVLPESDNETENILNAIKLTDQLNGKSPEQLNQEQQVALWSVSRHFTNIIEQMAKEKSTH